MIISSPRGFDPRGYSKFL